MHATRLNVFIGLGLLAGLPCSPPASAATSENYCLKYHRGTEGADVSVFINSCPFQVTVLFWADGKNLAVPGVCLGNKQPMCGDTVPANGQETMFPYTGTVHFAACRWPTTPSSSDGVEFSCSGNPADIWLNHRKPSAKLAHAASTAQPSRQRSAAAPSGSTNAATTPSCTKQREQPIRADMDITTIGDTRVAAESQACETAAERQGGIAGTGRLVRYLQGGGEDNSTIGWEDLICSWSEPVACSSGSVAQPVQPNANEGAYTCEVCLRDVRKIFPGNPDSLLMQGPCSAICR